MVDILRATPSVLPKLMQLSAYNSLTLMSDN